MFCKEEVFILSLFVYLWRYWDQGFTFSRQALNILSHVSALFALVILKIGYRFCPGQLVPPASYFKLPRMTDTCHYAQLFSIEMESHKGFCLGWPGIVIPYSLG
jgi:hypothetical protein